MGKIIKVLLVDDEFLVLERIQKSIAWEALGIELIGCCENALDALEQMINEMPDILITDIKMPVMTGLELIEKAKQMNPNIQCIVLTGHAEFPLAQAAINQGVYNYLLKPFTPTSLEDALQKCRAHILRSRSEKQMTFKQRTEVVANLTKELQSLKEAYDTVDAGLISELMKDTRDLSILREACMLLMSHNADNGGKENIKYISELFAAETDIYENVAELMNKIRPNVRESTLVSKIKNYTKEHYCDEELNLQLIADNVVFLGVKYIGGCFFKETGIKYNEYLMKIRMEKAKELMQCDSTMRIEAIAEQIGLGHDIPYFYYLFKKYTGVTPKEYRKRIP